MINGLGIVGWGVGGIEAEAGMLGQPVYFLTPERRRRPPDRRIAAGCHRDRSGAAGHGNAAESECCRQICRVFRRGCGRPSRDRPRDDRQYGTGIRRNNGIFPRWTKRRLNISATPAGPTEQIDTIRNYYQTQGMFGIPRDGDVDYTTFWTLNLETITAGGCRPETPAGPHRTI